MEIIKGHTERLVRQEGHLGGQKWISLELRKIGRWSWNITKEVGGVKN